MCSMCIYASLFCFTRDLWWFSNCPQTPVSAVGRCSLLNGGSSSLIALPINESIKDLTDFRQDPLHHSPRCWNELCSPVWGEGASWVWVVFFLFSIIEISYTYGSHQSLSVMNLLNIVYVSQPERTRRWHWDATLMFSVICFKRPWNNCFSSSGVKSSFVGGTVLNVPSLICSLTCKDWLIDLIDKKALQNKYSVKLCFVCQPRCRIHPKGRLRYEQLVNLCHQFF